MNIEDIILVLDVNKYKSFGDAAAENALSESSVSKRVKKVEVELGDIKLFHRNTRTVSLTTEGELFVEQAQRIVDTYTDIMQTLKLMHQRSSRTIRIGVIPSLGKRGVAKSIVSFYEEFSELYFQIYEGRTLELLKLIRSGELDVAFIIDGKYSLDVQKYISRKEFIVTENLVVIVNKKHRFAQKKMIKLKDVEDETLIMLSPASQTRTILDEKFQEYDVSPKYVQECAQVDMIFDLVDANFGIAILGEKSYTSAYEGNNAIMIPIENEVSREMVMLVSSKAITAPRHLKAFIKHVTENVTATLLD